MFQSVFDILNIPLGLLMRFLYGLFNNYAAAIFFFALAMKIILLPLGLKQQDSQIKMAKIRPKEQAIRSKYAGRTDSATQQKMQSEVMDMYKKENYSPMSGCLPLLVQLPILFALYGIIRNPLTYIFTQIDGGLIDGIKQFIFDNKETYSEIASTLSNVSKFESIQQIDIIKILSRPEHFTLINEAVEGFSVHVADFQNIIAGFRFFGQTLTSSPSEAGLFTILMLIPILNFASSFLQMRLQKVINKGTMATDMANNKGMKIMEYTMPLLIVYMSYTWYAALGLYWIFQSVLGIAQMIVLSKIRPIPKISEEEYEKARIEYGGTGKKKKKKKPEIDSEDGGLEELEEVNISDKPEDSETDKTETDEKENKDEKYISKTIPGGINPNVKNNYQKTGKKYKIKKRK